MLYFSINCLSVNSIAGWLGSACSFTSTVSGVRASAAPAGAVLFSLAASTTGGASSPQSLLTLNSVRQTIMTRLVAGRRKEVFIGALQREILHRLGICSDGNRSNLKAECLTGTKDTGA